MIKTILGVCVCFFLIMASAGAEEARKNSLDLDLSLSVVGVGASHKVSEHLWLQGQIALFSPWYLDSEVLGFGVELRPFFYLSSRAPRGWYAAPLFRYARVKAKSEPGWGGSFSLGGTFGYQWTWERWNIRGGLGAQYLEYDTGSPDHEGNSLHPTFDGVIGYFF